MVELLLVPQKVPGHILVDALNNSVLRHRVHRHLIYHAKGAKRMEIPVQLNFLSRALEPSLLSLWINKGN